MSDASHSEASVLLYIPSRLPARNGCRSPELTARGRHLVVQKAPKNRREDIYRRYHFEPAGCFRKGKRPDTVARPSAPRKVARQNSPGAGTGDRYILGRRQRSNRGRHHRIESIRAAKVEGGRVLRRVVQHPCTCPVAREYFYPAWHVC